VKLELTSYRTGLGLTSPSAVISVGVERPGFEAGHLHPCGFEN
jgi:hypothetical protein